MEATSPAGQTLADFEDGRLLAQFWAQRSAMRSACPMRVCRNSCAATLFGPADRHRFLFGRGMVSDDTEHTCLVAEALIESGRDVASFERRLLGRLRRWLLTLPGGVGLATLRRS